MMLSSCRSEPLHVGTADEDVNEAYVVDTAFAGKLYCVFVQWGGN